MGIPTVVGSIVFFSGIQLMILGLVRDYLAQFYLDHTGTPQYVVRYVTPANSSAKVATSMVGKLRT